MPSDPSADPWPVAASALLHFASTADRTALERALSLCADPALAQARRALGNHQDALDAVQESLLQIMRSARRYDPQRPLSAWVATIVHRACLRLRRSQGRRRRYEAHADQPHREDPMPIDAESLRRAVEDLTQADQEVIHLHYFAGLSQSEAATSLGTTANALGVRLHRARERLRRVLLRRGVSTSASAIAVALALPVAGAAGETSAAVAQVSAWHAAGSAPATTIPLAPWTAMTLHAARYPLLGATIAASLIGSAALAVCVVVSEPAPPAPVPAPDPAPLPVAQAHPWWDEAAQRDLAYLDPRSTLHVAADAKALLRLAPALKPTSICFDPDPAAQRWRTAVLAQIHAILPASLPIGAALNSAGTGWTSAVLSMDDYAAAPAAADERVLQRLLVVCSLGASEAKAVSTSFQEYAKVWGMNTSGADHRPQFSNLSLIAEKTPSSDQLRCWFGASDRVRPDKAPAYRPIPADLQAPLWLRYDVAPLIASVASSGFSQRSTSRMHRSVGERRSGGGGIQERAPSGILTAWLGAGWQQRHPLVRVGLRPHAGVWTAEVTAKDLGKTPASLIWSLITDIDPAGAPTWERPSGMLRGLIPQRVLAYAVLGLRFPTLDASLDDDGQTVVAALTGDVAAWVEPGMPLPTVTVVAPLRAGDDGAAAFTALMRSCGAVPASAPAPALAAASVIQPWGTLQLIRGADRLVATTALDAGAALAHPAITAAEHVAELSIDLPRLAPFIPLLRTLLPPAQAALLPDPALVQRHLAPWQLTVDQRGSDLHLRESGLPLVAVLAASACIRTASSGSAGSAAWWRVIAAIPPVQRQALHAIARSLGATGNLDSFRIVGDDAATCAAWIQARGVDRHLLAPLVGAAVDDDAIARAGRWWSGNQRLSVCLLPDPADPSPTHTMLEISGTFPVWLLPIPGKPGYSMGLAGGVPIVTDQVPSEAAPGRF